MKNYKKIINPIVISLAVIVVTVALSLFALHKEGVFYVETGLLYFSKSILIGCICLIGCLIGNNAILIVCAFFVVNAINRKKIEVLKQTDVKAQEDVGEIEGFDGAEASVKPEEKKGYKKFITPISIAGIAAIVIIALSAMLLISNKAADFTVVLALVYLPVRLCILICAIVAIVRAINQLTESIKQNRCLPEKQKEE